MFDLNAEVVTTKQNGNIGLAFIGTLTGAPAGYLTGSAVDFSLGFTQSSPTGAIGVGYSIDTPINPALVPSIAEPGAMTLLTIGLLGLLAAKSRLAGLRAKARALRAA